MIIVMLTQVRGHIPQVLGGTLKTFSVLIFDVGGLQISDGVRGTSIPIPQYYNDDFCYYYIYY